MRHLLLRTTFTGVLLASLATPATVRAARTPGEMLRSQVVRLHARLAHEALESPAVTEAHAASEKAYADLYQIRENILVDVRKRDEYANLKLALWHQQQMLQGQHLEVPVRVSNILATATDSMSMRSQLGKMEIAALEASEEYVAARDTMNTLVAAERQAIEDAIESVRADPQLVALSQQVQSVQGSYCNRGKRRS